MKKLAPLFAATAFALSGGVLANTADGTQSSDESAQPNLESAKKPHGFVVLQRNIYVPVDSDGKVASENWIVVEQQGFVSADEVNAAHAESGMSAPEERSSQGQGDVENGERVPKLQEPPAVTSPRAVPSLRDGTPILRGPHIKA